MCVPKTGLNPQMLRRFSLYKTVRSFAIFYVVYQLYFVLVWLYVLFMSLNDIWKMTRRHLTGQESM